MFNERQDPAYICECSPPQIKTTLCGKNYPAEYSPEGLLSFLPCPPDTSSSMNDDKKAAIQIMYNDGLAPADILYLLGEAEYRGEHPITYYFEYKKAIEEVEYVIADLKPKKRK